LFLGDEMQDAKCIGNVLAFGCIRFVNDDIVDLYSRVKLSTPVVVN